MPFAPSLAATRTVISEFKNQSLSGLCLVCIALSPLARRRHYGREPPLAALGDFFVIVKIADHVRDAVLIDAKPPAKSND
jgi:hypothetical protein